MNPVNPPEPPKPPSIEAIDDNKSSPRRLPDIIDDLGVTPESLAALALSSDNEWDGEQLDNIERLLEGEDIDPDAKLELLHDIVTGVRRPKPQTPILKLAPEPYHDEVTVFTPPPVPQLVQLEVPSSRVNLDDWLKKTKG